MTHGGTTWIEVPGIAGAAASGGKAPDGASLVVALLDDGDEPPAAEGARLMRYPVGAGEDPAAVLHDRRAARRVAENLAWEWRAGGRVAVVSRRAGLARGILAAAARVAGAELGDARALAQDPLALAVFEYLRPA
jgi:hypothetical protein